MDRACTAPGRASASRAALRSPWPSPATAVRGFPSSRSHSPVHILRGRATQKPSTPRYLGAPYLAGGGWFSRQLLCTSPSLTSCQRATAAVRGITRQAGQSQPDRDTILMHLTSFPALSLYSPTRLQECQVLSLLNCIHTEQCRTGPCPLLALHLHLKGREGHEGYTEAVGRPAQ